MKIKFDKILVKKTMVEETIGQWVNPKGFNLPIVSISTALYNSTLNVCFGEYREFVRFLKEICDHDISEHDNPLALFVYFKNKKDEEKDSNWLLITENNWSATDYGTLCHELHHFAFIALDKIGIEQDHKSEEAFAYFQGYFMERVVRSFISLKKKLKK